MPFFAVGRREAGLLFLLFITEFARGAFFFTFLPFWVVNYLGFSITVVGFAVSAHYLTETIFKTIAGWEFDRLGRPILVGGLLLSFVSLLVFKSWPVAPLMIAAAGLFGLGFSPLWLGVMSMVAPVGTPNRATRISMVFATWLAGAGSGMVSVNFIMARNYDAVFWVVIALWTLSLIFAWFSTEKNKPAPGTTPDPGSANILKALKYMVTNKITINILFPGMFLQTLAAGLLLPVLPLFVQHYLHLNHNQYGLLLTAGGVTAVVSLLPMGYLADRVALKFLLGAGFGLSSLLLGCLIYSSGAAGAFLLAVLLGFSYAMILPAWNSLLAKIIPPDSQAMGWGVFATIEGLGITVGPALGSVVARLIGMPATLLTTTGVLLIASFFYLFYPLEKVLAKE
ncbi:MAG: MFS transporter [Bacillota bacterium]